MRWSWWRGREGSGEGALVIGDVDICGGGGVDGEGALSLTDVVTAHRLHADLGNQLAAIVHSQGLTLGIFSSAGTRCTRGNPS